MAVTPPGMALVPSPWTAGVRYSGRWMAVASRWVKSIRRRRSPTASCRARGRPRMKVSQRRAMSLLLGLSTACLLVFPVAPVQRLARAAQIRVSSLAIAELQLPSTLNPLLDVSAPAQDIASGVFESLLMPDTHNVLQPSLATSWSVSGDGRTYTFALDPRARWQDGVAFSAEDVLFTAKLIRDPKFPAVNRFGFGYLTSLRADGPLTVTATLRTPYAPFLRAFAGTPIVPAHVLSPVPIPALAAYTAFNRHPIGTGPYMVTEFVPGDHVTLGAYSGY